jgi:poly-gamma-glutamate synthesis protein (capsule biosynthesis protein)
MVLGGDLHVQRPEPESIFASIGSFLQGADILFGNLEMPPTTVEPSLVEQGLVTPSHSEDRMMAAYSYAGFDAVALANNHAMDHGPAAFVHCLDLLEQAGIQYSGGGRNREEAHRPAIVDKRGTRVAFLSYTSIFSPSSAATERRPGMATVRVETFFRPHPLHDEAPGLPPTVLTRPDADDLAAVQDAIRDAKRNADVLVVSWHWGQSPRAGGQGQPLGYEPNLAHAAIDAGADLVLGHHPHMLEAVEVYRGKPVFYSVGNFAFDFTADKYFSVMRNSFILVRCLLRNRNIAEVSCVPLKNSEETYTPILRTPSEAPEIVERLLEFSKPWGTRFQVRDADVLIEIPPDAGSVSS